MILQVSAHVIAKITFSALNVRSAAFYENLFLTKNALLGRYLEGTELGLKIIAKVLKLDLNWVIVNLAAANNSHAPFQCAMQDSFNRYLIISVLPLEQNIITDVMFK